MVKSPRPQRRRAASARPVLASKAEIVFEKQGSRLMKKCDYFMTLQRVNKYSDIKLVVTYDEEEPARKQAMLLSNKNVTSEYLFGLYKFLVIINHTSAFFFSSSSNFLSFEICLALILITRH